MIQTSFQSNGIALQCVSEFESFSLNFVFKFFCFDSVAEKWVCERGSKRGGEGRDGVERVPVREKFERHPRIQ